MKEIKYINNEGAEKTAIITRAEFPAEGLSQEQLQTLDLLKNSIQEITPIYSRQTYSRSLALFRALEDLEGRMDDPMMREALADFNTLFAVGQSPYDSFGQTRQFPLSPSDIPADHVLSTDQELNQVLFGNNAAFKGRSFYPSDITDEEFKALGGEGSITNSSVVRLDDNSLNVVLNENRYRHELSKVRAPLEKLLSVSTDEALNKYVRAKINELATGCKESIRESDLSWIKNTSSIDFTLGSGVETYMDKLHGVRGSAQGALFMTDNEYNDLSTKLLGLLPEWEATAPWEHKKEVNVDNLPKLKYVNVLSWAGFYNIFPMMVAAQSLPNDKVLQDTYGSVNLVFVNIQKARGKNTFTEDEFFLKEEMAKYQKHIPSMGIMMTAIHELGHTTGGVTYSEDPHVYFGKEYSVMEEGRAELFSMWTLPNLVKHDVITQEQEIAGYYSMVKGLLNAMRLDPVDHSGARNMMLHYFMENDALVERNEDGKTKYVVNPEKMRPAVKEMIGLIGDIKARGDKDALASFREQYMTISDQDHFKKRFEKAPLGAGCIFPELEKKDDLYTGNLIHPATFREQKRALTNIMV